MPKSFLLRRHFKQEWNYRQEDCPTHGPLQFDSWDGFPLKSETLPGRYTFLRQNTIRELGSQLHGKYPDQRRNQAELFTASRGRYMTDMKPNQSLRDIELNSTSPGDYTQTTEYTSTEARDKTRSVKIHKRAPQQASEEAKQQREASKKLSPSHNSSTSKQPYKCDQCGKIFKTKYTLTIHLKMPSHTGAKPFVCAICGKGFRLSSTLCRHKIIHTSEKPHKCHICDKAFNRSSTLKTHVRTHSEFKEFVCDICGKGFHQKGNLRNHVLIHTGEKPYHCNLCEKAFNKLSNLKFHMHIHTDNAPYRCRLCKTCFTRRCDLKLHIAECNGQN